MEYARVDPAKIMTAEACGECHVSAYEVWMGTTHATTFETMHRKERAETIAKKLGFDLIKRDSFCFSCHYTPVVRGGAIRVVSGVSCESCHGAGRDWIDVHNDYGAGSTFATEPAEHRSLRLDRARQAGMRVPSDLYGVAANCFSCHSVPNERLVNEGGHATGSAGFELVAWSQGEMRHNFLDSLRRKVIGPNETRSPSRQRVMYVAGRALDLEYSLRGAAQATVDGVYSKAMERKVRAAAGELAAVAESAAVAEVGRMLAAVKTVRVVPGNGPALLAAADAVGEQTRAFLVRADAAVGDRLAALDPQLRGESAAPEVDHADEVASVPAGEVAPGLRPGRPADDGPTPADEVALGLRPGRATDAAPQSTATPAVSVVGQLKHRIHPPADHRTLGPEACSGCHESQNKWWFAHAHYRAADPFFAAATKNVQIARLYGIEPRRMTTGSEVCMDCHGTIVSGKESRDVLDGVSCESCHGPAADWLEPHKDERGKELGRQRPGYQAALVAGKRRLDDPVTRAGVCTGCHYVTEPRLLSAGHPSGAGFDYSKGMAEIKHWQTDLPADRLAQAFQAQLARRGAVPDVQVATLPVPAAQPDDAAPRTALRGDPTPTELAAARAAVPAERRRRAGLAPPPPRPAAVPTFDVTLPATARGDLDLPPFPKIDAATPIDDALLLLRDRLRLIYDRLAPRGQEKR